MSKKKTFKSLEDIIKERDKKIYTSSMAEYKRNIQYSYSATIFRSKKDIWKDIVASLGVKDTPIKGEKIMFDGQQVFILSSREDQNIEILFFREDQFITFKYSLKELKNSGIKVTYTQVAKRSETIAGFNGKLGTIKYKWAAKKNAIANIAKLKKNK